MQTPSIPYLKSWLMFFLIATVGGGVVGAIFGMVLGAILGAAGVSPTSIAPICGVAGFVLGIPISFLSFQWSVRRFVVAPLLRDSSPSSPA
jgi:hypothetical protein